MTVRVVFVCLGNICRSPMAEGVFRHLVKEAGLEDRIQIDSCGTGGWHVGEPPHRGTQLILRQHGIDYQHRARQIDARDLRDADYLIAMDMENLDNIRRLGPTDAEVGLLLDYAEGLTVREVPDPYYNGRFEEVYRLVEAGARGLLKHIREKERL